MQDKDLIIPPWVIEKRVSGKNDRVLLGPRLQALQINQPLEQVKYDDEALQILLRNGFLTYSKDSDIAQSSLRAKQYYEQYRDTEALPFAYVVSPKYQEAALSLLDALYQAKSPYRWVLLPSLSDFLDLPFSEQIRDEPLPLLIILDDVETHVPYQKVKNLFGRARIMWFGECAEGTHAGPIFETPEDVKRYVESTGNWAFAQTLKNMGFHSEWPLPIFRWLYSDPTAVAKAIIALEETPPDTCCLIDGARLVSLWTALRDMARPFEWLLTNQQWSKGIFKNLRIEELSDISGVFLGVCQTPCSSISLLEWNSGKGLGKADAEISTLGEAIERFAAWEANQLMHQRNLAQFPVTFELKDFHPFGVAWESYCSNGMPPLPQVSTVDEISDTTVGVPACLIPFPYLPQDGLKSATTNSTTGLAAYPTRTGAVVRGALEVLERHNFYPAFLHQQAGFRIDPIQLPHHTPATADIQYLMAQVERLQIKSWLIVYENEFCLPITHAFLYDQPKAKLSRGSGSGSSITIAAKKAILEALQIRDQHERDAPSSLGDSYANWTKENVLRQIIDYLDHLPTLQQIPWVEPCEDEVLLAYIKATLAKQGLPLLSCDLPCPVGNWSVVRVLIPGLTTIQYASNSAGGRRVMHPVFTYKIPT